MKAFKHWGKEATRSPTRRTSRVTRWDDPDYRGDFDDMGEGGSGAAGFGRMQHGGHDEDS